MKNDELIDAIKCNDAARVATLLDEDRSLLKAKMGNTPAILLAIYYGRPEIAKLFTDRGAELTFSEAVAMGDSSRVRSMLDADPSLLASYSDDGFPAAGLAIFFRHPELARDLIQRGADVNAAARNAQRVAPIHAAAAVADIDSMRLLLDRGADANARQEQGYTALHEAARKGSIEMAKLLTERGADPLVKNDDGKTPLDIARASNQTEFVEWLSKV